MQNQSMNIMYTNEDITFWCPIIEKLKLIIRIHACLIWCMNFDAKENGEKESFSCETKASISCIPKPEMLLQWPIT